MDVDPIAAAIADLGHDGLQPAVVDLDRPSAFAAHDVVMVFPWRARDVGVLTARQVDALERAALGEEVERSEHRCSSDGDAAPASVSEQVGRSEVPVSVDDQLLDSPARAGVLDNLVVETRSHLTMIPSLRRRVQRYWCLACIESTEPMPTYDATTALLVVDVQNDFADPHGTLYVAGGEQVVPFINQEIARAQQAGARVFYTQDWHPQSTPHFEKDGGIWPVHCVQGSWGAEFEPRLAIRGPVVQKGSNGEDGYSGFTMRDPVSGQTIPTPLADLLVAAGVTTIVLAGLATDYCVKWTVLDARQRGYPVVVLENGIRAVDLQPGDGDRAIEEMFAAGALLESRAAVSADDD